ncbi:YceK/YidQ family lipoprotein [Streptococcus parasuis]
MVKGNSSLQLLRIDFPLSLIVDTL